MKEITLNNQDYLLVEVPNDAHDFYINDIGCIRYSIGSMSSVIEPIILGKYLEKDKYNLIGKISNIVKDEEICKGLVEHHPNLDYRNYNPDAFTILANWAANWKFNKATDSFQSWLKSIDLDMSKQWIMIKLKKI